MIKKYGAEGTHLAQQAAARERLALPRAIPDPGEPAYIAPEGGDEAPAAEAAAPAAEGESQEQTAGTAE